MYKCLLIETQELKNTIKELREENRNLTKQLSECKNTINENNDLINYYMIKLKSLTCKYNTLISENRNYARSLTTKSFSFETDIEDLRELDGEKILENEVIEDEIIEDVQENKPLDEIIEELKTVDISSFKKKNSSYKKKFPLDMRNNKIN